MLKNRELETTGREELHPIDMGSPNLSGNDVNELSCGQEIRNGLPNRGASGNNGIVRCKKRLGGLLKYYEREAACAFGRVNSPSLEADEFITRRGPFLRPRCWCCTS